MDQRIQMTLLNAGFFILDFCPPGVNLFDGNPPTLKTKGG
jgi:hypothetical protein